MEGHTDALAMAAAGLPAIGRPSNMGGVDLLTMKLKDWPADREIIVVGENDKTEKGWPGKVGAESTAAQLAARLGRPVKMAMMPDTTKDARAWLTARVPADAPEADWHAAGAELAGKLVTATQDSAPDPSGNWELSTPFGRDTPPPLFPVEVFPAWVREFVSGLAHATQTPVCAAAMLALGALSGGFGGKVRYFVRRGWTKAANLFVVVAMDPGERKSSIFKAVFEPVRKAEQQAGKAAQAEIAQAESELAVLEARLRHLQHKAAKEEDPADRQSLKQQARDLAVEIKQFKVPAIPVFLVDDETLENLGKTLIEQGGRLTQAGAEGTAFSMVVGRYADDENFDVYLKSHDGDPLRVGRVSRGRQGHDSPALTCALAVQPDVLACLGQSERAGGRGFLARWLYSVPLPRVGYRQIRPRPTTLRLFGDTRKS